jgi:25S rRNA (uracil2634-N3)-methyltransferase
MLYTELLVSFFSLSQTFLSPPRTHSSSPPSIIVTLFEGAPYDLWNIRDLARHAGLAVEKSFRFRWDAYPGYKHARTLGVVKGGGGWRGEERAARSFVFARKGEVSLPGNGERKTRSDDGSSDEDGKEREGNWDEAVGEEDKEGEESVPGSDVWDGIQDSDGSEVGDDEVHD